MYFAGTVSIVVPGIAFIAVPEFSSKSMPFLNDVRLMYL